MATNGPKLVGVARALPDSPAARGGDDGFATPRDSPPPRTPSADNLSAGDAPCVFRLAGMEGVTMTKNGLKLVGVASALTHSLAACGGDEDFDTPGDSSPTETQDAEQLEPTDTPSESDTSDSDDTSNGDTDSGDEATSFEIDIASDEMHVSAQDAIDIRADEVGV